MAKKKKSDEPEESDVKASSEEEMVKRWGRRLAAFESWKGKKENFDKKLNERFMDYYRSMFYDKTSKADRAGINLVYAYVSIVMAGISKANPKPLAVPRGIDYTEEVNVGEAVLAYEMYECNYRKELELMGVTALLNDMGGWVKVGYDSEFGYAEKEKTREDGHRLGRDKDEVVEYDEYVKSEHPIVKWVPSEDVAFDCAVSNDIEEASWAAIRVRRTRGDMRDDPAYRQEVVKKIFSYLRADEDEDEIEELWEIWDKKRRMLYVYCEKCKDDFLMEPKLWPYDVEGFPLVHLKFVDVPGKIFGQCPVRTFFQLVEELNRLRSTFMLKSRHTVPKWVTRKNTLDSEGKAAFEDSTPMTLIETLGDPSAIVALDQPQVPMDERHLAKDVMDDFRFVSGTSEQQAGVGSSSDVTATEVIARQQSSQSRIGNMRERYEHAWEKVLKKVLLLVKQFYKPDRIIPIIGEGQYVEDWTKWTAAWRDAEYDIVGIQMGSTAPMSREARQQRLNQAAQTIPTLFQGIMQTETMAKANGRQMDGTILLRELIRPYDDDIDDKTWKLIFPDIADTQDPYGENRTIQNGGMAIVLPGDNNGYHLKVHIPFYQDLVDGKYGTDQQTGSAIQMVLGHIKDHQGAMAVTNPTDPNAANLMPPQNGGGGNGNAPMPQANAGNLAPAVNPQAEGSLPPNPSPGQLGGRANSMVGQAAPRMAGNPEMMMRQGAGAMQF